MYAFAMLIDQIINLYIWTLLAYLATGWLIAFKIINPWQPLVRMITDVLSRIHEPLLRPVMRDRNVNEGKMFDENLVCVFELPATNHC